ncbi:MAG: helix-turn-helix transcriptional regulator [Chloroflexi bacterium]|nr:MAG: helix-turn-helix transcriptional regulator [Chloroflexota bacterium]
MIKNERQYKITKAQADRFAAALEEAPATHDRGDAARALQRAALRSQLDDLREELNAYDQLRSGKPVALVGGSFADLPKLLIQARIARGLSQRELAERLGMKEQQLQRYEATDYASASIARLNEVIEALGLEAPQELLLPDSPPTATALFARLSEAGLDRALVLERLLPRKVAAQVADRAAAPSLVLRAAANIARIFGWRVSDIFGRQPLKIGGPALAGARFKVPANVDEPRLHVYTMYAHYLALLLIQATDHLEPRPLPKSAPVLREAVVERYGSVTFENVVRYVWDLGIPVLPLADSGAFHAACWRVSGRNVIALKQRNGSAARWLFDLIHELWHLATATSDHFSLIESDDAAGGVHATEEQAAMRFAGDVVLDGKAEALAQRAVALTAERVDRLKTAAVRVAADAGMPVDLLANYLAHRLSFQGVNWWGTANNLQDPTTRPWAIARDILLERADLGRLDEGDRGILERAIEGAS